MPNHRIKEEERIERVIRGLLKLPENKRCINCNSLGPQYVCTTFWTFVCTNCSGVHREFTHRVKSVSMAKFSSEEVTALQAGGNERARQLYFKTWDYQRNAFPDASNLHRLRNFIKHVYEDRKYSGERNNDIAMDKAGTRDDYSKQHSFKKSGYGAREGFERHFLERTDSGRGDDVCDQRSCEKSISSIQNDDRNLRYYIDDRSSPRYRQETLRCASHRSRAAQFEIVDDRFREAGFETVKRYGSHRLSNADPRARSNSPSSGTVNRYESHRLSNSKPRARSNSPAYEKSKERTSPPKLRPMKDILGNNFLPLKVGEPPKSNDGRNIKSSAAAVQKATTSTSSSSGDKKEEENKTLNTCSLIDFDSNPEPTATTAVVQTQQKAPSADVGRCPAPSSTNDKASTTPNVNPMESLLFELADPANTPAGSIFQQNPGGHNPSAANGGSLNVDGGTVSGATTNAPVLLNDIGSTNATRAENISAFPNSGRNPIQTVTDARQFPLAINAWQLPVATMEQNQSFAVPAGISSSTAQQTTSSAQALCNQPLTSEPAHAKGPPTDASSEPVSITAHNTNSGNKSVSNGINELPAGLFTSSHSSLAAAVPDWQFRPPYGMGYGMQYQPTSMAPHDSIKSANPFDLGEAGHPAQATMFPSMSSLQGALQSMSDQSGLRPQAESHLSAFHPQGTSHGMMRPQAAYMGQQILTNMMSSRPQGTNNSGINNNDAFASLNPIQQSPGTNPTSATPNSFIPSGANPFG